MLGPLNATFEGADWAAEDIELAKKYPGKWVIAIPNEIIAMGDNPNEVRAHAAEKLGLPPGDCVITIIAPLESRIDLLGS